MGYEGIDEARPGSEIWVGVLQFLTQEPIVSMGKQADRFR